MGVASILYTFTNLGRGLEYQTLTYNVVMLTVLLGIFAHGITAAPVRQASRKDDGARRYRDGRRDGDAAAGWSPGYVSFAIQPKQGRGSRQDCILARAFSGRIAGPGPELQNGLRGLR